MAYKPKYPSTYLEDLSPREGRKLWKVLHNYRPERVPPSPRLVRFILALAIVITLILGGLYVLQ